MPIKQITTQTYSKYTNGFKKHHITQNNYRDQLENLRHVVTGLRKGLQIKVKSHFRNKDKTRGEEQTNQKQKKQKLKRRKILKIEVILIKRQFFEEK